MNHFNYWYEYIIRNGEFVKTACGNSSWKVFSGSKNKRYEYTAMKKTIGICCRNWQPPYDANGRMFVEENFDVNHPSIKPLISMRKIV